MIRDRYRYHRHINQTEAELGPWKDSSVSNPCYPLSPFPPTHYKWRRDWLAREQLKIGSALFSASLSELNEVSWIFLYGIVDFSLWIARQLAKSPSIVSCSGDGIKKTAVKVDVISEIGGRTLGRPISLKEEFSSPAEMLSQQLALIAEIPETLERSRSLKFKKSEKKTKGGERSLKTEKPSNAKVSSTETDDYVVVNDYYWNNSLDDMNGRLESGDCEKDGDDVQSSPADVPVEDMLSDDYYEQDGDGQSDSFHHREINQPTTSNLKKLSRPVSFKKNVLKKSKSGNVDGDYYDNDEEDGTFFLEVVKPCRNGEIGKTFANSTKESDAAEVVAVLAELAMARGTRDKQYSDLNHFQKHWIKGELVIVRDVLEFTSGLSWDPLVKKDEYYKYGSLTTAVVMEIFSKPSKDDDYYSQISGCESDGDEESNSYEDMMLGESEHTRNFQEAWNFGEPNCVCFFVEQYYGMKKGLA
ncbi:hypothetical protein IFM89_024140 [Coptis chinensis]|uniref:Uncharacterized protein n=1 Tax=Coptis chinensis TaxID=261450 RepID=A0A835I4X5_9MAGN|nr:hypothetical protein IFM89_024140 [Coptis chinensis]